MFGPLVLAYSAAQLLLGSPVVAVENGLARTPPLGWNSWNWFACDISEETILSAARAIVSTGLKDAGYEYVIIDDCWHAPARDPITKEPLANPVTFPSGIKSVADKVHDLGLKFGIYSDAGSETCARRFGSLGYEQIDAKTYASWGVDYLKYDNCNNEGFSGNESISSWRFSQMAKALNETGRPIVYAMCNWGEDHSWTWAGKLANSWRMSGDISDMFTGYSKDCPCTSLLNCTTFGHHCSATRIIDWTAYMVNYAGPGGWNDLDMLEVGNGNMTNDEYVTHFSMWALLKSPLILGNYLTKMTPDILDIITNDAIIAVNQDPLGASIKRSWKRLLEEGDVQMWTGPLADGSTVVALMNTSPDPQTATISFKDIPSKSPNPETTTFRAFDLWQRSSELTRSGTRWGLDIGLFQGQISDITLKRHQTKVFMLVPQVRTTLRIQEDAE
ncbi:glycoside hydrolase family 27 protein [Jaapia argillacea MUCL 33604]|uniref:Alpha-galactosidase n=1 Tax=Jaapia argillacea MUCL 33604 TaxID=933084 RepID=A0A067PZ90_9AGAM|nr:glycoside hydrolase family 27 protein [Jaapia argillacea MUCL 33604]